MIHIQNLPGSDLLTDNSELCREVASYMLYFRMELLEDEKVRSVRNSGHHKVLAICFVVQVATDGSAECAICYL